MTKRQIVTIVFIFLSLPAFAVPHIRNLKLAVTNSSDQPLTAATASVRVADLTKIARDFDPAAVIVTATNASTVAEDAAVIQAQEIPFRIENVSGKAAVAAKIDFQLDLAAGQTRIVTVSWGPPDRIALLRAATAESRQHRSFVLPDGSVTRRDATPPAAPPEFSPPAAQIEVKILSTAAAPQSAPPDTLNPAHHRTYAEALKLMQQEIDRTAEKWLPVLQSEPTTTYAKGPGFFWEGDNRTGEWKPRPGFWWTGSFWTAQLWRMYGHTKDEKYRRWAEQWADRMPGQESGLNHDVGFLYFYSQSLGYDLTREDARRQSAIAAGQRLKQLFNPATHLIASWGVNGDDTIIDTMMNLQVLWWLSRQTGDPAWREIALTHARRSAEWLIRPDGSTFQSVHYNPGDNREQLDLHGGAGDSSVPVPIHAAPGERIFSHTHQGYSAVTTWGRGHAWAIYGFTAACAESKDARLCDAAQRVADYALANLPGDNVTWYDFNDEGVYYRNRDTSAAAIMAAGMLRLSELTADRQRAQRYRAGAEKIVQSLIDRYLTPVTNGDTTPPGVLRHGSGTRPHDGPIVYGQYYLLEALLWLDQHPKP